MHLGFVVVGIATTLVGPILPALAARWLLSDAQAGLLFTAQFLGSMSGVALSSVLLPQQGFRLTLSAGFGALGLGVGVLGLGPWPIGLLAPFVFGIGLGLTITGTNLFVAEESSTCRASALSLLNLAWGIGAVLCPPLALVALQSNHLRVFLLGLAMGGGLMATAVTGALPPHLKEPTGRPERVPLEQVRPWRNPLVLTLGALFFLYVGTENALSGWTASYAKRLSTAAGSAWAVTPSYFWAALTAGRAVTPALLRRVAERKCVVGGLLLALMGAGGLLVARSVWGVTMSVAMAGLGLAPIFPILVAWLSENTRELARRLGGVLFALGGLGGATLPWLVGIASAQLESLRMGLVVPLFGLALMMLLVRAIQLQDESAAV